MSSLCDVCAKPGACCKGFVLTFGPEEMKWINHQPEPIQNAPAAISVAPGSNPNDIAMSPEKYYAQCAEVSKWTDPRKIQKWIMDTEDRRYNLDIQQAPEWKRKWKIALMDRQQELERGEAA